MSQSNSEQSQNQESAKGITRISVSGYKSLYEECSIEVRPLTILSGANSSGKSSIMQPLLLMKQTLEATYDPGSLLLNSSHVQFTSAQQLLSHLPNKIQTKRFSIKINLSEQESLKDIFEYQPEQGITLVEMTYSINGEEAILTPGMIHEDISDGSPQQIRQLIGGLRELIKNNITDNLALKVRWIITRNRCFFEYDVLTYNSSEAEESKVKIYSPGDKFQTHIRKIIHVPGLRGNPERTYKRTSVGSEFPGTFENYVASVINHWQRNNDNRIQELNEALEKLGLTSIIEAKQLNDTQFEIKVSRLPCNSYNKDDMVSIADVGFGISQTLPILVALILAEPEQLVYLEQPEIHLHPRAQVAMAERLANTASRGVRVVVETHSDRLLLAIQSLVAEGKLSPELVKLHWFTRQEDGTTKISSANLDETGAFGDWPEDFADVSLNLENRYLTAAEARLFGEAHGS